MSASNIIYDNALLEAKLTELLDSSLEVRSLMTLDDSLTESAGLTKIINRYTYSGKVEELAEGEANASAGRLTFVPETYTVKRYQQTFRYNDAEAMRDPSLVDMALAGAADVMANQLRGEYFAQLMHIRNRHPISGEAVSYTDIVDALSNLDREVEEGMFILMGMDSRAAIRRDPDFISARQGEILYSGQFGTLCGIPVLISRLVPAGMVIITEKAAVKFFVKKEAGVEQSRNIETKENTIVYERHGVIALVDDTSSVILGKGAAVLGVSGTASGGTVVPAISGMTSAENSIRYAWDCGMPLAGENIDGWAEWTEGESISVGENGGILVCAETDEEGNVLAAGTLSVNASGEA